MQLQNGVDYTLEFKGPYDTPEEREKYTGFMEQALERMPELAQKLVEARALNGSIPKIMFTDRVSKGKVIIDGVLQPDINSAQSYPLDNTVILNPDMIKNDGKWDTENQCVEGYPLVFVLGHELGHLADPEFRKARLANKRGEYSGNGGPNPAFERVAMDFEDSLVRKYGREDGISERKFYLNSYTRQVFSWGGFGHSPIDEMRRCITGHDAVRTKSDDSFLPGFSIDNSKYPDDASFCSADKQPGSLWLSKAP